MSHTTITFLVIAGVVVLFILDRFPVAVVAVATALTLWATGVLDLDQALAGFGDPAVLFIASLFIVSESLDATGVTAWAGQQLVARVGESRTRLLVLLLLLVAAVSALITVNGAAAALLPVAVVLAIRLRRSPSQLLLPLAFGAHAGSLLTLSGSPVNVIASEFAHDAGAGSFGYFSFAWSASRSSPARSQSSSSSASGCSRTVRRARAPVTSASTHAPSSTSTGWMRTQSC